MSRDYECQDDPKGFKEGNTMASIIIVLGLVIGVLSMGIILYGLKAGTDPSTKKMKMYAASEAVEKVDRKDVEEGAPKFKKMRADPLPKELNRASKFKDTPAKIRIPAISSRHTRRAKSDRANGKMEDMRDLKG